MGCDPGVSGAMAVLDPNHGVISLCQIPTQKIGNRRSIDLFKLSDYFDKIAKDIKFMVIEDVHSMPGQGVASMFSFGKAYGVVLGMAAAFNIPQFHVNPAVWKGSMNLGRDKKASIDKAQSLFPVATKGITHGEAEALLLAHFGKRFWGKGAI